MIWLFHRCGEYMACEARTSIDDTGFEILISRPGQQHREWCANEEELMRRWQDVTHALQREGWGEVYTGRY